ncbi:MAG: acyl-CoA dehydrogenase [Gammaproteobacteria bacterium CG22_combo_CG10-13_8_21_14_all_40_8]|nr:MAG: acyl-CoA dehydrogenase [Gammaproteobacteria bacterium CG22_combo_CG10-13_8_21_14_all_40_8]
MLLTEEQTMIREAARQYVASEITPYAAKWDEQKTFPQKALKGLAELGFYGMLVPEAYGGCDIGHVAAASVIEEIAFGDAACSTVISVTNSVACMPILKFGDEFQKQTFLKPLASGQALGAFCLTEPQAGSDASDLKTKAVFHADAAGDYYVLNGVKQFITSAKNADIAIVFAVTDPNAGKKGLSAFIVPVDTKGYEVTAIENKMGQNASDTGQITFEDCKIPAIYRLGQEGEGYKIALSNLEGGRIGIAAQSVGIARAAFEASKNYAKERKTFGKSLVDHQVISFKLADMATKIDAARLLYQRAAELRDHQLPCLKEASMAKLFASEMAEWVCSQAIQIHGGYGYLRDFPVEKYYRDVRVCQIYEGASEIQRLVIGRAVLND